ncbi:hypothetical protein NDU88_005072 [Pleurodeles waltl]|uniref:Uncharacterized protein n=1 Tax=Pleurodeles waltl TaxID=8319 RepID=A0AAV7TT15_PLEWA|nr:hypothetical protein NDU88_005072 [Pleurodeles waltl]
MNESNKKFTAGAGAPRRLLQGGGQRSSSYGCGCCYQGSRRFPGTGGGSRQPRPPSGRTHNGLYCSGCRLSPPELPLLTKRGRRGQPGAPAHAGAPGLGRRRSRGGRRGWGWKKG